MDSKRWHLKRDINKQFFFLTKLLLKSNKLRAVVTIIIASEQFNPLLLG